MRCREVWIPDVFGYPAGLPQVFAAGGMDRFVTQKLSWNRQNRFPHSTFWWEGIDGTRVLTHFPPVDTYNAEIEPAELAHSVRRFAEHEWSGWSLMPFGYGDGGGGPTREMLERLRRLADLDGMPQLEQGVAGASSSTTSSARSQQGAPVPVWRGELYFETHRGTLTSQLRTKLGNKRCERLLREAELWTATAGGAPGRVRRAVARGAHAAVPRHHPGVVDRLGARRRRGGPRPHRRRARGSHRRRCSPSLAPGGPGAGEPGHGGARRGRRSPTSTGRRAGATPRRRPGRVPGAGARPGDRRRRSPSPRDDRVVVTDRTMTNGHLAVSWDLDGNLRSVIDVAHARELLPAGELGAVLELGRRPPRALRRVGPRGVGARRPGAAHRAPTTSRSSSTARSSGWCRCNDRSGRRRRR